MGHNDVIRAREPMNARETKTMVHHDVIVIRRPWMGHNDVIRAREPMNA